MDIDSIHEPLAICLNGESYSLASPATVADVVHVNA